MVRQHYDLVVVGGGLAGASLARAMASSGARVLVLERERVFRDRVRGDLLYPWGVAEARRLGIHGLLVDEVARKRRTCPGRRTARLRPTRRPLPERHPTTDPSC